METTAAKRASPPWISLTLAAAVAFAFYFWKPPQKDNSNTMDLVHWRSDLSAGQSEADDTGKPLLVEFGASWCPDCQWMKTHVFSDGTIAQRVNSNYVPVSIDDDAHPELVRKFDIHEIPEFFVIDPKDGSIVKEHRHGGGMDGGAFSSWLP
jgi:thiol:disulfide interchange protein